MIKLQLQWIREDCQDKLEKIEHPLTEEDLDWYHVHGWKYYHDDNHIDYLLPSLGEPFYLSGGFSIYNKERNPVVEIKGRRYSVGIEDLDYKEVYEPDDKSLILTPTESPLSVGTPWKKEDGRRHSGYKFFGQPSWIQRKNYPAHEGKPCYHFLTVENGWGDSGNWNILLALDDNNIPIAAYFEASCC